jgi:multiple sugar transport system ATP-binding protein
LFDEPLSNLDAQLRDEMRSEIKRLHQEIGTTMIYVTHDQIEAMTLADRIVLLREGQIEQQGTPLDLFERPATRFVAGFLGSPKMNFVPANVVGSADGIGLKLKDGKSLALPAGSRSRYGGAIGSEVIVGIRPEHMARARDGQPANGHVRLDTAVELIQPTGSRTYITFSLGETSVMAEVEPHDVQKPGEPIAIDLDLNRAVLIDPQTSRVI